MRGPDASRGRLGEQLTTPRLLLAPLTSAHAALMYDALRDPELYRYEVDEPPRSLDALRQRYAQLAAGSPDPHEVWVNWIVVERVGGGAVGYVQATVSAAARAAMIGYLIAITQQRRGFGAESVGAACAHLEACGIDRLEAWIDVRNAASIALAERCGFVRVATARSQDIIGGLRGYDHRYVRAKREVGSPV